MAAVFCAFVVACDDDNGEPEAVADDGEERQPAADQERDDGDSDDEDTRQSAGVDESDSPELDGQFEYPGFDLDLQEEQRRELAELAVAELCPCPDEVVSLHECMQRDERCDEADEAARTLVGALEEGAGADDAFDSLAQHRSERGQAHHFVLDDVPYKGNPEADIVVVEFADFNCGQCRRAAAAFDQVADHFGDDVVIYFKHFPLGSPTAQLAAQASMAAYQQGRFWEMHDLIFENQQRIDRNMLDEFARQLGLNFERYRQDMESNAILGHIQRDRLEGREAGVNRTPSVFINGEFYTGIVTGPALIAKIGDLLDGA